MSDHEASPSVQDGTQEFGEEIYEDAPEEEESGWAKLVSEHAQYPTEVIPDTESKFTIGRGKNCNMVIPLPIVSTNHCRIERDGNTVWLWDLSTNGTFVRNERIGKGNRILLFNGDKIVIVQRRANQEKIEFMYVSLIEDQQEAEEGGPQGSYHMLEVLGSGAFATVRKAIHKTTNEPYAIKIINKKKVGSSVSQKKALEAEVEILKRVDHRNIIGITEVFETEKNMYLVLELVTGGELFDKIVTNRRLSEDAARPLVKQMIEGVEYLHNIGIAHRDLKPENVLVTESKEGEEVTIKISDFGLSRIIGEGSFMKTVCGTPQYLAPEVLAKSQQEGYTLAVDVWSIGVIIYTMLAGYRPFEESESMSIFQKIKKGHYSFPAKPWDTISEEAKDLIRRMVCVDVTKRCSVQEALSHPWITGLSRTETDLPEETVGSKRSLDEGDESAAKRVKSSE